jgi:hypothetical protein
MVTQKNVLILIGFLSLSYVVIFLTAPKDATNYTIVDTEYWRETGNSLLIKTAYDYNDKNSILSFPTIIGDWKSFDYRYPDYVYDKLNADMLMSRAYTQDNRNIIWMDIINSKTGESFHKQKICVKGAGWTIDNEDIAEFDIAKPPNRFVKLYVNRLYVSKENKKQVMVYWFMFKKFGYNDSVTMIRLSSPVKNNSTEHTFNNIKGFVEDQLFGTMYKDKEKEETTTAEYLVSTYGNKGLLAIITILAIPIGITITGFRRKE